MRGERLSALVVGAGLIGRNCAYQLCLSGVRVRLIDAVPGHSITTRGSLGVLTHFNGGRNPLSHLYRDSHASFAGLSAELRAATGMDIGWREPGGVDLIFDDADAAEAEEKLRLNRERGCPVEEWSADELLRRDPGVHPAVRGALYYPGDHRVDPERLSAALVAGVVEEGGMVSMPERLGRIRESTAQGVVASTDRGEYAVDYVVLAAGSWTRDLAAQVDAVVPVRPIRGQHARTRVPGPRMVLRHGGRHVVPSGTESVVGATVEEVGFDPAITAEAHQDFAAAWQRMVGAAAAFTEQRAGLRPKPKGGRPLIGPLEEHRRIFVATGHYKNGVLMGPMTGRIVASWITTGAPPRDMSYFRPER